MKKILVTMIAMVAVLYATAQPARRYFSKEERLNEEYCSGIFKTADGTYFDLLNDNNAIGVTSYINVLGWLQGRVAGLQVYTTRDNTLIPFIRNSRAGIYVDEIYRDPSFLNLLPVSDIAMIKVIKGPFVGAFNSPGGVVAIYTIGTEEEETDE